MARKSPANLQDRDQAPNGVAPRSTVRSAQAFANPATGARAGDPIENNSQTRNDASANREHDKDEKSQLSGTAVIQRYLKTLTAAPGVYRMLNARGDVIYVGKARSLKARVASYARLSGHSNRIARMILSTVAMEFVTTRTESEALLLEANLIKRFRPHYNVLLRDDKSFPYIVITRHTEAPMITKHRGARNDKKGIFFGPFASAGAVNRTINTLQRAFLLRTCTDAMYDSRTRPCLQYQIKRCAAPCTGEISANAYRALVDEAQDFLRGKSHQIRARLQEAMQEASDRQDYETAAEYRNRLAALSHVTADQNINPEGIEEADIFACHQDGGQSCIQVFFFRTGQNWGNRAYFPRADRSLPIEDVLEAFIAQFYDDKPVPRMILLSHDIPARSLLGEALSSKAGRAVKIMAPRRGGKRSLVDHALSNAREALGRRLADSASQRALLEGLADRFGLDRPPARIEVYDNSHIQGAQAVGAMIVAGPEGLVKNQYRKFNIKSQDLTPGDDYAMMREVLMRRFKRLLSDHGATDTINDGEGKTEPSDRPEASPWPDLVLVDGGLGQLSVACDVLAELGIDRVRLIGVAKGPDRDAGREHFHIPGRARPIMLEPRDPVLYFVQRLRDEAHRFAIGSHRQKRKKALTANPLDEIPGIGPARKRALLQHFGSAKATSRAGIEDFKAAPGISGQMAQAIYDFFHDLK